MGASPVPPDRGHLVHPPEQLVSLPAKRRGRGIPGTVPARQAGDILEVLPHEFLRLRIPALNGRLADTEWQLGSGVHRAATRVLSIELKRLLK